MSTKPIVLVTGGTGYVGSHVIYQLLEQKKYIVRATARQTSKITSTFPHAGSDLQVVHVPSLTADHAEVLKGVWALVHCAAPLPSKSTGKQVFDGAYEGAISVVEQAIQAGVKKIVVTGSTANTLNADLKNGMGTETLSEKTWGATTAVDDIDLENGTSQAIYVQAKTLSERKIWALAHENSDVDITVLLPPLIVGPFVPNYPIPAETQSLGSVGFIYNLISGKYPQLGFGHLIDVRDCARTHVLSLSTPPLQGRDKRFVTEGAGGWTYRDLVEIIRKERPSLAHRLPPADTPLPPNLSAPYDSSFTEQVLGFKKQDYITMEKTILDSIDDLVSWEKKVNKSG